MRRHQKEQAEKERLRLENEKRREKEEEERKGITEQQLPPASQLQSMTHAGAPISQTQQLPQISTLQPTPNIKLEETRNAGLMDDSMNSPAGQDKIAAERERQRQREQERRRREAVSRHKFSKFWFFSSIAFRIIILIGVFGFHALTDGVKNRHELSKRLYGCLRTNIGLTAFPRISVSRVYMYELVSTLFSFFFFLSTS